MTLALPYDLSPLPSIPTTHGDGRFVTHHTQNMYRKWATVVQCRPCMRGGNFSCSQDGVLKIKSVLNTEKRWKELTTYTAHRSLGVDECAISHDTSYISDAARHDWRFPRGRTVV